MKNITSHEDQMRAIVTYELDDGRRLRFSEKDVRLYGIASLLRRVGIDVDDSRLPVMQRGEMVGALPASFDPLHIKSKSALYDPRPGDFRLDGKRWIAAPMLGLGDLQAVEGFQPA